MNLLAIDTSTDCASVALIINGELRSESQSCQRSHAQLLLPMVESVLLKAGVNLKHLDGIAYGRGPGSFTGLRIACSVAKGLAYAADLPLYPVSSLATIANEVLTTYKGLQNPSVLAVIDARMSELYWTYFNKDNWGINEQVSPAGKIGLEPAADSPLIIAGVGYEAYLPQLDPALRSKISEHYLIYPKAEAMIRLVLTGTIKGVSASSALPFYIRNQITQGAARG
ncbi:MAG: tRNA (adenosine(37)-N6)-threonylcarbamoyltransferase complex dimerization subunit type 1 TsaB [Tatlockia sp.]|nr:tRNA (adenosine(37)-N6)-threonylcarbamoyltransferase complex dimerization subunit type 1 TsaB [Tatlockia sp.]